MLRGLKAGSALAAVSIILSGCVSVGPGPINRPPTPSVPTFAEGTWQQGDLASYVFGSGSFVGTANDTGNKVADGTYRYINQNTIQISSFSAVRQTTIVANCLLINQVTLNCTNDSGLNFQLSRNAVS